MGVGRQKALTRMEGLVERVEEHLEKIAANPASWDRPHWRGEVAAWLRQIEVLVLHVGKRTGAEWRERIETLKKKLGD